VILDGDGNFYEYVVFGFSFDVEGQLLDTQVDAAGDLIEPWQLEIDAGIGNAKELTHALDHDGFSGSYLEEAAEDRANRENSHYRVQESREALRNVHR
jgi:hypothetical protein